MPNLLKLFQKTELGWGERGNYSKHILQGQHYPHTKSRQGCHKKRKLQANIPDEHICKNGQTTAKQMQQYINRIIHHNQVGIILGMQEWFNIVKSVNVIHHINEMKDKNQMISIDAEKASDEIQHWFMIKTLNLAGIEGTYLNIIKAIYNNTTATIILNSAQLKAFLYDQEQDNKVYYRHFDIVLKVLAGSINQK